MPATFSHDNHVSYIRQNLSRPVVLVGLMGSGKSRLGRRLAHALEFEFHDTDALIEERVGYSVNEIFTRDGEPKFREAERSVMMDILKKRPCIIATGGGMMTNAGIPETLKQKALTIWLRAEISEILGRVKNSQNRPLLNNDDAQAVLEKLLKAREPLYAGADISISADGSSIDRTGVLAIRALYDFLKNSNLPAQ